MTLRISAALVLGLASFPTAFASYKIRPVSTRAQTQHTWFCTADGYDYNGRLRSISGGLKGSRPEAAADALRACHGFYTNCSVASCFQEQ